MDIRTRLVQDDAIFILELDGRLDTYMADSLKVWLDKAAAVAPANVVVNMSGVSFIDSSGLAMFVQGMKNCRDNAGNLHLCSLQKPVRFIFELMRLDRAFDIFASEEDAVRAFQVERNGAVSGYQHYRTSGSG